VVVHAVGVGVGGAVAVAVVAVDGARAEGGEVGADGADKVAVVVLVSGLARVVLELAAMGCVRGAGGGGSGGPGGGCQEEEEEGVGEKLHVGLFFKALMGNG
jgi:hypothetical protein